MSWNQKWVNLPPTYRLIWHSILFFSWFHNIPVLRKIIVYFSCLRFSYLLSSNLLSAHSFHLFLNDHFHSTCHNNLSICNASHLLFSCPDFLSKYRILSIICSTNDTPFSLSYIFQFSNTFLITSIINFFLSERFLL